VAPTGRRVEAAFCVLVGFKDGKVAYEHIYWDQASILVQIGLIDAGSLPVTGVEQARRILAPDKVPANGLIRAAAARKRT
jgi:carboxymethylenebutenolidase